MATNPPCWYSHATRPTETPAAVKPRTWVVVSAATSVVVRPPTWVVVKAPMAARAFLPGQFYRLQNFETLAPAIGGTTLGIGQTNNRLFETGWSTDIALLDGTTWEDLGEQGAAGGGPSLLWAQPGYQKGVVPAALATAPGNRGGKVRSVPDISADADPFTGMAVGLLTFPSDGSAPTYSETDIGGTSLAAPLVAGIVTAAQQGQAKPFGLANAALYQLAGTSAVHDALPITSSSPTADKGVWCGADACGLEALTTFDDQSLDMFGYTGQVTLKGYDNMSGIGTPAGQLVHPDLRLTITAGAPR